MMERITERNNYTMHENGVCCTHFLSPECYEVSGNCSDGCKWEEVAWSALAAYEDTGLTPEEIKDSLVKYNYLISLVDKFNAIPRGYF